jgi:hypothetical protein
METRIIERKRKSIELATNLYNSMLELSNHWTESGVEVSDTLAESGYPFDKSLDDLTNEVGTWIHIMKGYVPPKNGKHEYINDDGSKFVAHYKDGKLHGTAIEYYPNTEQIDTYIEFYEGVESSPKVYFSEIGTIVSIENTLNELSPDTIGSFLRRLLKMTAHKEYNGFKLQYEGLSDTFYLTDTKHDGIEIGIDISKEGISFKFNYENGHIFLGHDFPKNSHEIEEYINKFHNVYAHTVTELHNTLIANVRVFGKTDDSTENQKEGWGLFNTGLVGDKLQIQKIDDMVSVFSCDIEAIEYVVTKAKEGSERHKRAIEEIKTKNPTEYNIIKRYL